MKTIRSLSILTGHGMTLGTLGARREDRALSPSDSMRFFAVMVVVLALGAASVSAQTPCSANAPASTCIGSYGDEGACSWFYTNSQCATLPDGETCGSYTTSTACTDHGETCQWEGGSTCTNNGPTCASLGDQGTCENTYDGNGNPPCQWYADGSVCEPIGTTHAPPATCSSYGSDENACYADRATCHFDTTTLTCVDTAPANCHEFFRDTTGCTGAAGCAVNAFNSHCYTTPTATPVSGTCDAITTDTSCISANCFWDAYAPTTTKCYASLAEVRTFFPTCDAWSNYPAESAEVACTTHSPCAYFGGGLCANGDNEVIDTSGNNNIVANMTVVLLDPEISNADTLAFTTTLVIPIQKFLDTAHPIHYVVSFGSAPGVGPLSATQCNSLRTGTTQPAFGIGEPRISPAYDSVALQSALLASTNLDFDGNTAVGAALLDAVGNWEVNPATKIVSSVVFPVDGQSARINLGANMDWGVANCGWTRTRVSNEETHYFMPIHVNWRQGDNELTTTFNVAAVVNTYGVVQIGATSATTFKAVLNQPQDVYNAGDVPTPAVGTKKRTYSVSLIYGTHDATQVIGLRDINDVTMGGPYPQGSPANCFGTEIVSVVTPASVACPVGLSGHCWKSIVNFQDRYTTVVADGNSLNLCGYQTLANRAIDMGVDGDGVPLPYPAGLDGKHNFYVFPHSWAVGDGDMSPSSPAGNDPTGVSPDFIGVTIHTPTPLDTSTGPVTLTVPTCGFLPTANSPLTDVILPTEVEGHGFVVDMRNQAVSNDRVLYVVCYTGATQRDAYLLTMDVTDPRWAVVPVNSAGQLVVDGNGDPVDELQWDEIQAYLPYNPRAIPGADLGVVKTTVGTDGLGLPIDIVRTKLASTGYGLVIPLFQDFPTLTPGGAFTGPSGVYPGRRLLQAADDSNSTTPIQSDVAMLMFLLPAVSNGRFFFPVLGSNADAGKMALALLFGLAAFGGLSTAVITYGYKKCKERGMSEDDKIRQKEAEAEAHVSHKFGTARTGRSRDPPSATSKPSSRASSASSKRTPATPLPRYDQSISRDWS